VEISFGSGEVVAEKSLPSDFDDMARSMSWRPLIDAPTCTMRNRAALTGLLMLREIN
jgi:hypothetical protein